ncbi:conjugal transfer protein TraN [Vibrio parahaemolyticus]|uniref:conjugal transfer protein TraN n=1 Tax=Vibrio parahaemolyticus TaxID=670 RepID=UPI003D81608D
MFKKAVTWLVMVSYSANLMTAAFAGVLVGMISIESAMAAPQKPVQLQYTCPSGTTLIGGQCMKTEIRSVREYCDSGYYRDGSSNSCLRDESAKPTPICGSGFRYDERLFPDQCFVSITNDKLHDLCPSGYPIKQGRTCYKVQSVQRWNCPADAPGAAPETTTLSCSEMASSMGECNGSSTFTTPDQRWKLDQPARQCNRTLWKGINRTCDAGFEMEGDACKRVTLSKPTRSCPSGYFEKENQCFPGTQPSCPAGSTMRYGVCHAPNGTLSCPQGKYLDSGSNLCVANRNDSQPTEWTSQDFNHFFEQGADLGGMLSSSVTMPSVSGVGSMNMNPSFLNAEVSTKDANLYNAIAGGGVDANNGFTSPDGTYQNEDNQSEFVRDQLKTNKSFLENQQNVPGATSEEQVDNTNHSALAYGALMDSRNLNPPRKVSRDSAMFQVSRETVGDAFSNRGAYFGDCSADTTTYQELDPSKIVTSQKSCFKPNKNNESGCIVDRILHPPTLNIIEGADNAKLTLCGEKCVRLTLGKDGDNYLHQVGQCGIYEDLIRISLKKGNKLNKATIVGGRYDDHMRLSADNQLFFNGVHGTFNTPDGFPTTSTPCERSTNRYPPVGKDVTKAFADAFEGDDEIIFQYKAGSGGVGEAFAIVELNFDEPVQTRWDEEFKYLPEGCNDVVNKPGSFCTADQFVCDKEVEWTPIFLGEWATEDTNGNWVVQKNPNDVMQTINGDPTSYISEKAYELNSFKGYITVTTADDDDWIGFVVGVPEKGADLSKPENSYFVVSWKQGGQKGAAAGISLAKVTGPMSTIPWVHQNNAPGYEVLATNLGTGWRDHKKYEFRLDVRPDQFVLAIDGEEKLSVPGNFHKGRVGFYNNSQSHVLYSQVEQLYPAGMGRDAEFLFKPLWSGASEFPVCMTAHRPNYVCDPLKGKKLQLNGASFGFKDIINMDDACVPLDKDDQCDAISQECVPGWEDQASGKCYAWNVNYECQDTSNAVVTKTRKNDTCFTEDSCIDGTCDVRADETNTDFTNALTTYATMNELGDTKNCTTPNDPNSCRVFSGEPRWCGWDQLKVNDCCEQPSGVNVLDVFRLGQQMYTVTGYMASADGAFGGTAFQTGLEAAGSAVEGVWNSLTDPIADAASSAWNTVSSKLSGAVGNTAGNTSANLMSSSGSVLGNFKTSVMDALSNFKDTLMQKIYDLLPEALQNAIQSAAQSLGASAGASGATAMNTVATSVMNVISFIGWAYAVYQLAKLAYTMLTACKKEEEDMGVQLLGKKCFKTHHEPCDKFLGICKNRAKNFYCCYESVLSRIIMQQATAQLGWNKKTFRNSMNCRGLKIEELSRVDFSKIDFSEWINMMAQSDMLPVDKSMEEVTGGNISNGFGRSDALQRNKDRAPNNAWVERREEMEEGDVGNNVNCNQRPRPKACDQGAF